MSGVVALIVNYESGDRLRRCVDAVLSGERPPERVLVVDNGSRDGSIDGLPSTVDVISLPDNPGYGAAIRAGMAASDEAFVLTLNPDVEVEPRALAAAHQALESDPGAGSVAMTVVQASDPQRLDATGIGITSRGGQINWDHGLLLNAAASVPKDVLGPLGGAALWRRSALDAIGGFATHFFLYWEDMDVALRLNRAGYTCPSVPESIARHEGSASTGHWSRLNVYYMVRNHWPCLIGGLPRACLMRHAVQVALAPLRAAALYASRGRPGAALAGLIVGAALLPATLLRRRHLPKAAGPTDAAERIEQLMAAADENRMAMKDRAPRLGPKAAP